jgi:hypothetical protein
MKTTLAVAIASALTAPAMAQTQIFQGGPYGAIITQPGTTPQSAYVFQNGNTTTYVVPGQTYQQPQPNPSQQNGQQDQPGQNWQQFQPGQNSNR